MKIKNIFLISILLCLMATISYATHVVNLPAASTAYSGNIVFNVTSDLTNTTECNVTFGASNTANTSVIITVYNYSNAHEYVNATFNSLGVQDSSIYTISTIKCANSSGATTTTTASRIFYVDNTPPTTPSSLSPSTTQSDCTSVTLSATVTAANTTHCTINFPDTVPGGVTSSVTTSTESSGSCSYTLSDVADGIYKYKFKAEDGLNSSTYSAEETLTCEASTGGAGYVAPSGSGGSNVVDGLTEGVKNTLTDGKNIKGTSISRVAGGVILAAIGILMFYFGMMWYGTIAIIIGLIIAFV